MGLNIYWGGMDSIRGYQSGILHKLDEKVSFSYCLLVNKQQDNEDHYEPEKYELVNYDICANCRYEESYDLNDYEPLSEELLEVLAPYEPTALKMLMRITEFDIFNFEEAKRLYLMHVRFWNHMLTTRKIDIVFLTGVPHHTHDYVIYSLAMVKRIPLHVLIPTIVANRLFTGTSMNDLWKKTAEAYERITDDEVELPEDIEHFYQAIQYKNAGLDDKLVHAGMTRKEHSRFQKRVAMSYINRKSVRHRLWSRWKHGLKLSLTEHDFGNLAEYRRRNKKDLVLVRKTRRKLRTMHTLKEYDKLAENPDYSKPFVIFLLQLQPEATTLPQGGVFVEMYLAVQILSKALENTGIQLYVKEHFVQPYRANGYYSDLKAIRGVRLIKSTVDSKELLRHCLATATCTGTIIFESIANGKPTFVFGKSGTEQGPGIFKVTNLEQCQAALHTIRQENYHIDQKDVRRYFKAYADGGVYAYENALSVGKNSNLTLEESQINMVNWAEGCIEELGK